jgi:hypothetical protein
MNPRVKSVKPESNYVLRLTFTNGEVRRFDVKPYLSKGIFQKLRDPVEFNSVRPFLGSIQWKNEADLCPDMLYEQSTPVAARHRRPLQLAETNVRYKAKR